MNCIRRVACLLLLLGFSGSFPVNADDPDVDRLLAAQCAQCHGTDGRAVSGMDSLAGEDLIDLYDELLDMKGEDEPLDIMEHQALGYTDEQLFRIARYFSSLPE